MTLTRLKKLGFIKKISIRDHVKHNMALKNYWVVEDRPVSERQHGDWVSLMRLQVVQATEYSQ